MENPFNSLYQQKRFGFLEANNMVNNIINDLLNKDGATIDKSTSWGNFFGSQVPSLLFFLMIRDFLKRALHAPGRGIRFLFKEKRNLEQHGKTKTKQNKTKLGTFKSVKHHLI